MRKFEWLSRKRKVQKYGLPQRIYFRDAETCTHPVALRVPNTMPLSMLANKIDTAYAWISDSSNGCRGNYTMVARFTLMFEDPDTAFLVKMRFG